MTVSRQVAYQDPEELLDRTQNVTIDVMDTDVSGTRKACLVAQAPGLGSCAIDVEEALLNAIDGKMFDEYGGCVVTQVTAKAVPAATNIRVLDDTGFALGDPIAIFNVSGGAVQYNLVDGAPALDSINLHVGLSVNAFKGAYVCNLAGRHKSSGQGYNYRQGVRAILEAPSSVSIDVADAAAATIDVTITPNDEEAGQYYDVYVRTTKFTRIQPNWIPDAGDQTGTTINVTTKDGGADSVPAGTGTTFAGGETVFVAVVVKSTTGRMGSIKTSELSNVVEFTLDTI